MKTFMLFFVGLAAQPTATDAETRAYNQKWGEWTATLAKNGALQSGLPLEQSGKIVKKDLVSDYVPETQDIYGYMLINAASLDEAIAIARQAPHMALGGTTIVRPCINIRM